MIQYKVYLARFSKNAFADLEFLSIYGLLKNTGSIKLRDRNTSVVLLFKVLCNKLL